jgi:hypothetical protein
MATSKKTAKKPKPKPKPLPAKVLSVRKLDVHAQFATHAESLVKAAKVGAEIHKTGNIAESGGPLEMAFRHLFSYALPSTFLTTAGYFFGHEFELSGQIDFLLCDETDVLKLPPQEGMVTGYVPYRSVKVIGQLKNSSTGLADALNQASSALSKWEEMAERHPSGTRKQPLVLIVIGTGGTDAQVRKALANFTGQFPAYILLLDKGLLYGPRKTHTVVFDSDEAFYSNQGNGGPLMLLEASTPPLNDKGRMLMWLFFAVLYHVVGPKDNTTLARIVERAQRLNPVNYSTSTSEIFQKLP